MKREYDEMDKWLRDRIDEDLMAMADERERLLMESEELQDVEMPMERLQDIHREIEARRYAAKRVRIRRRMIIAVAAVTVSCVGLGLVGSGNRLYKPEVIERELGDEVTTKINNADAEEREYIEEEVCQEIEKEFGMLPVRFIYRPKEMFLEEYLLKQDEKEATLSYIVDDRRFYVYVSKDYKEAGINSQVDGKETDSLLIDSCGIETKIIEYQDSQKQAYYSVSFEYLNTYYSIFGMIEKKEFIKILENIAIKNV